MRWRWYTARNLVAAIFSLVYGSMWLYVNGIGRLPKDKPILKHQVWGRFIAFGTAALFAGLIVLVIRLAVQHVP
ncbi:hypothetical protein [Nocardia acidivorans]|uniref:hypothetical protein n=1 Tax=Nocardia acidivorans TaxID=404580 RepID=UPI00083243B2|nr:hypothetical protein [Nocardia acidivorans]